MNLFETNADAWQRTMVNHLWTAKSLRQQGSDKTEGYCRAAAIARAMWLIAEVLGQ